jgi:hypothetical protein
MAGNSMNVSPDRQPIKKLKVQNMNKSPAQYFQPEQKPVNEQKVRIFILQPCYSPMRLLAVRAFSRLKPAMITNAKKLLLLHLLIIQRSGQWRCVGNRNLMR